jgi:hypothetical protein
VILHVGLGQIYTTIQDAITAAGNGDTIQVLAGTYGGFTASVAGVSIVAVGQVTIAGSLLSQIGSQHLDDFFQQNHPSYSGTNGITVSASNVSISGFTITGFATGINVGTSDGVVLTNNTLTDNVTGLNKSTAAVVTNLTVNDNTFTHGIYGMGEPGKNNDGPDALLQNVSITNATVTDFANVTDPMNGGTATVSLASGQIVFDASTSQADVDVTGNALANTIRLGSGTGQPGR